MTFTFVCKHYDITDKLREYAEKKVSKLEKYFDLDRGECEANVKFSSERGRFTAEITIRAVNGMIFRVSETTNDMRASIDSGVAMLERQVRKHKTRLEKRLRNGAFERTASDAPVEPEEEDEFVIVRSKRVSVKPMTPEEAILQMELLGHDFFVFLNAEAAGDYTVVYRRKDGGYGLIAADDTNI